MAQFIIKRLGIFFLILQVFSITLYSARNGSLKGTIKDAQTKDVLPFTNVILVGTSMGAAADMDGNYIIRNVPPGSYVLRAKYIGYQQQEINVEILEGRTTEYNIMLKPEAVEGETVIVTAQAEGQMQAINEQLSSLSIKNVVSSARIQELPDANAAESVSRLPGVSIIRTGGEGARVVVRGLSPQYNRVTIDGVELPSNYTSSDQNEHKKEFNSNDELSLSGDRATDLSMISSNMLGGIEVIKAITPDMDATVLGGVINFSMRKAIKSKNSEPRFELLTQGGNNNLKNKYDDYKFVGSFEQRFIDNNLGIFLQGSVEKKNLSANELNGDYVFKGRLRATDFGDPSFVSMSLADILRDRDRYGATLVLDYMYENGSIGFMNFFSKSKTNTIRRSESYNLENDDLFYSTTASDNSMDVYSNLLSIHHDFFNNLGVDLKLSHSYSRSENPQDVMFNFWLNYAGFANKYNKLRYSSTKVIASNVVQNAEDAVFYEISNIGNISKDRTYNASLDLNTEIAFSNNITSKLKAGGAIQYKDRSYDYNEISGSVYYDDGVFVSNAILAQYPEFGVSTSDITFADFVDENYDYGEFLNGEYTPGPAMNEGLMMNVFEIALRNQASGIGGSGGGFKENQFSSMYYDYSGNETRSAGYAMATINIGQTLSLVPGLRYQNLTTTYTGVKGERSDKDISEQLEKRTKTESHGYVLPMFHFRYKPLEWLQVNFAYTNTLNYPDYNAIIPRYYVGKDYIMYNNYKLKPARSENFDLFVSIYSNEIGLLSVGGFKKNISDLIFPSKTYPSNYVEYPELEEIMVNKKEAYSLYTYINSPITIDVLGLETEWQTSFWYLPAPLSGIVLNINYTHIFSEADYPKSQKESYLDENYIQRTINIDTIYTSRLLNQPNDIINVSLGYDYKDFSFRASMLYKDNIFKKPDFWAQNRIHSKEYLRFDLSVKQKLPWYGIQVFLNLNNITGEDDIDINQKTGYITSQQRYGMSADAGIRLML